jgi:hypothetical protein
MRTLSHDLATGTNLLHNQPSPVYRIAFLVHTNYPTVLAITRDYGMTGFPHSKYLSNIFTDANSEFLIFDNGRETWSVTVRESSGLGKLRTWADEKIVAYTVGISRKREQKYNEKVHNCILHEILLDQSTEWGWYVLVCRTYRRHD